MTEGRESEVLLRQLDRHVADPRRARVPADAELADKLVAALRRLIDETAVASAAAAPTRRSPRTSASSTTSCAGSAAPT